MIKIQINKIVLQLKKILTTKEIINLAILTYCNNNKLDTYILSELSEISKFIIKDEYKSSEQILEIKIRNLV